MSKSYPNKKTLDEYSSVLYDAIPLELHTILDVLWKHHKQVYIIGGAVRNCLLGVPTKDFDIVTNTHPKEVEKLLNSVNIKTRPIGSKHGTILAIFGKNMIFEISTFRQEIYSNGMLPKVVFVDSLEEDLVRRDFSFNAIAFDPKLKQFIDKYNGFMDIREGIIRTIGDPYSKLSEDATRVLRLARFYSQFNLQINPDLLSATYEIGKKVAFYSHTALKKELFKLLRLPNPVRGLKLLCDTEVFTAIFPKFPFSKSRLKTSNIQHILEKFSEIPARNIWIRLFGLLIFLKEGSVNTDDLWQEIGRSLRISAKEQMKFSQLFHAWVNFPLSFDSRKLKRWIRSTGINTSEDLLKLVFIHAELYNNSNLLSKKGLYLNESLLILKSFRNRSKK